MSEAIDTLRVLVTWLCNLHCPYCCNQQGRFRKQFREASIDEIDWARYRVVCISGGEPLLFPDRVEAVCGLVSPESLVVLYTNGTLLDRPMALILSHSRVSAINVGLHGVPNERLIGRIRSVTHGLGFHVRFHANEDYISIQKRWPGVDFRFWKLDDCDRPNEDRVILRGF